MTSRPRRVALAITAGVFAVAGCGSDDTPEAPDDTVTELANPASEFCIEQGGEVEIVDGDDGEAGVCVLPDGTRVDEWEYFRENSPDAGSVP
jgi:putative hemolysin